MSRIPGLNKKKIGAAVVVLLLMLGGVAFVERTSLLSWYYIHNLAKADESNQAVWVERVAGLGEEVVPAVLDCLTSPDPTTCRNARAALARLTQRWGLGDPRTVALAIRCGRDFNRFSPSGQQNVLELAADWFRSGSADAPPAPDLLAACVRFLTEASTSTEGGTQEQALELCAVLLAQPEEGMEALSAGRDVVHHALTADSETTRARAVDLALLPGMDLQEQVVPLLSDASVEVRRRAISALGPCLKIMEDDLMPSLHDDDPEVRRLCTLALLENRKLMPEQIRIGFLFTAPDPVVRVQLVDYLHKVEITDSYREKPLVDQARWLTRVSHDSSPAIRAAAARAMSRLSATDPSLAERLDEMARTDPSATVCMLAKYYLENPERHETAQSDTGAQDSRVVKNSPR